MRMRNTHEPRDAASVERQRQRSLPSPSPSAHCPLSQRSNWFVAAVHKCALGESDSKLWINKKKKQEQQQQQLKSK